MWEGTNYQLSTPGGAPPSGGIAQTSGGYTHIVDFTDPMNPRKVGRYHLEDYGSHDIIVEDDVLYQAYYDGGVRIVDVSGELLGNLYDQGREIAVFKPYDPEGLHGERAVRDERDAVEGAHAVHGLQQRAVGGEAGAGAAGRAVRAETSVNHGDTEGDGGTEKNIGFLGGIGGDEEEALVLAISATFVLSAKIRPPRLVPLRVSVVDEIFHSTKLLMPSLSDGTLKLISSPFRSRNSRM